MEFTAGYISNALTTAFVKKDINPSPTPCLLLKSSLYFSLSSKMALISTSLKVVNIALSFLAETKRSATFLRNMDSFDLVSPRLPPVGVPIDGTALTASSLVIRPSRPDPETESLSIPFSSKIFLAAGEGTPDA